MSNISYSNMRNKKEERRAELHRRLDNFATFKWRDVDMWKFGVFIISERNKLKFYNGASFSNTYTKPLFQRGNNLQGVTMNTQTISFRVGVYYFTEEEYRELIDFLNPYVIDDLVFTFDENFRYLVKLTGREDSDRVFIEYNDNNERVWYTEMTLKFEVQGEPLARGTNPYEITSTGTSFKINTLKDYVPTDLDTPFTTTFSIELPSITNVSTPYNLQLTFSQGERQLFAVELTNLEWSEQGVDAINITYDSESGLLYWETGNRLKLLTLLTSNTLGENIVNGLEIVKSNIQGKFSFGLNGGNAFNAYMQNLTFTYTAKLVNSATSKSLDGNNVSVIFECYPRTTLI